MKILIAKFSSSPFPSNTSRFVLSMAKNLINQGAMLEFLIRPGDVLGKECGKNGWKKYSVFGVVQPKKWHKVILFILLYPLYLLGAFLYLLRFKIQKGSVIICMNLGEKLLFTPLAGVLGLRVYWIEHTPASYWLKYNPLRLFYAVLARLAYIIVLYDFVKSGLEGYWVAPGSIYHIPPSIDTEAIYNKSQEKVQSVPGKFIVCSAGALHKKKGFHVVIKAIKIAREFIPNIEYVIIGDGPERENLQWLIRTLGLEQVVRIVTRRDEIYSQIASSNVYVMPDAQREAFGYEVLDAMACQRAIVAPDYGCFAELITSGQNGILVPGAQPESYAQALVTLANEPQTVTELGNQAIRHVYMHYDSEALAQTLYNDLESAE